MENGDKSRNEDQGHCVLDVQSTTLDQSRECLYKTKKEHYLWTVSIRVVQVYMPWVSPVVIKLSQLPQNCGLSVFGAFSAWLCWRWLAREVVVTV